MKAQRRVLTSVLSAVVLLLGSFAAAGTAPSVALVIPGRYALVKLGLDMAWLRSVNVVSYTPAKAGEPLALHVWDPMRQAWVQASVESYRSGAAFQQAPQQVVVAAEDEAAATELSTDLGWASDVTRTSLAVTEIINTLNTKIAFSDAEWQWLSDRYGLRVRDLNADRRRWGKYGRPVPRGDRRRLTPTAAAPETIEPVEVLPGIVTGGEDVALEGEEPEVAPAEQELPEAADEEPVFPVSAAEKGVPSVEEAAPPQPADENPVTAEPAAEATPAAVTPAAEPADEKPAPVEK